MTPKLLTAATLLLALPCAFAQTPSAAPASPAPAASAPRAPYAPMGSRSDRGDRGGMDHMRFHGPDGGGPGGEGRLLPPGTWWRNQDVVTRIGLTADQQKHIDQIFLDSRVQLIHMHASLEEEQLRLDSALSATPFNQATALAEIDKLADTRASLEKANAKMLLSIRGVLNPDQWTKLQTRPERPRPEVGSRNGGRRDGGDRRQDWRGQRGDNGPHPNNGAPPQPPAAE